MPQIRLLLTTVRVYKLCLLTDLLTYLFLSFLSLSGRVVSTSDCEDQGLNHAADSCVYRDSHCDTQPWARAVHLYCGSYSRLSLSPLTDGKMSISLRAE